jgi:hypothetical protein
MKKTPSLKSLRLDRTTIARLDDASLVSIAGAVPAPKTQNTCSCQVSCATK